jgi:hypothetical protein
LVVQSKPPSKVAFACAGKRPHAAQSSLESSGVAAMREAERRLEGLELGGLLLGAVALAEADLERIELRARLLHGRGGGGGGEDGNNLHGRRRGVVSKLLELPAPMLRSSAPTLVYQRSKIMRF